MVSTPDELFEEITLAVAEAMTNSRVGRECLKFWYQEFGIGRAGITREALAESLWEGKRYATTDTVLCSGFLDMRKDNRGRLMVEVVTSRRPKKVLRRWWIQMRPKKPELDLDLRTQLK